MDNDVVRRLVKEFRELANYEGEDDQAKLAFNHCADLLEAAIPKHEWQWYMNGTFCIKCNQPIGTDKECDP